MQTSSKQQARRLRRLLGNANSLPESLEPRLMLSGVPVSSGVPVLNSLPGSSRTLYLDFNGSYDSVWGAYSNISSPAYDQDGEATTFSTGELTSIQQIWAIVAEDYAPFNVNVTTVAPVSMVNAHRVVIGGSSSWTGASRGGLAYTSSFYSGYTDTSFVFPQNLTNGTPRYTGDAASHEAAHAFGLRHQSTYNGSGVLTNTYNPGNSDLAPIMGSSYYAGKGLWWYGTTTSSSTFQDDLSMLADALTYRTDDFGGSVSTAGTLTENNGQVTGSGVIGNTSDKDYFSFTTGAGQISLTVAVPAGMNNLTATLELRSAAGDLVAIGTPNGSFGAQINFFASSGTYFAVVGSSGGYGNIGQFSVSGTIVVPVSHNAGKIGIVRSATWFQERSGNFIADGGDSIAYFGNVTDLPIAGDWDGDGFDEIGVFRGGQYYLDINGSGTWNSGIDATFGFGTAGDLPLIGDWDGDGIDNVGVKRADLFYLDLNGNRLWDGISGGDVVFSFGNSSDIPVVGDWSGVGVDRIGIFRGGVYYLDVNGNRVWDGTLGGDAFFNFGTPGDSPLIGDWNADGTDDVGVKRGALWYLDMNGNRSWDGTMIDRFVEYGNVNDQPLVGKWSSPSVSVAQAIAASVWSVPALVSTFPPETRLPEIGCSCPFCSGIANAEITDRDSSTPAKKRLRVSPTASEIGATKSRSLKFSADNSTSGQDHRKNMTALDRLYSNDFSSAEIR